MKEIRIVTFFEAGKCHLESFESRAEIMLEMGYISAMPTFRVEQSTSTLKSWLVIISCPEQDTAIWFAFYSGIDLARNNRPLITGTE